MVCSKISLCESVQAGTTFPGRLLDLYRSQIFSIEFGTSKGGFDFVLTKFEPCTQRKSKLYQKRFNFVIRAIFSFFSYLQTKFEFPQMNHSFHP